MAFDKDSSIVAQTFNLDQPLDFLDEETLLKALAQKIAQMLHSEPDLLFSTLYRLDVLEHKIQNVLNNPAIPNDEGLAQLVISRQKEKIETRKKYQSKQPGWIDDLDF
jgi:hypothetical protein